MNEEALAQDGKPNRDLAQNEHFYASHRLPAGRHRLPRKLVIENQRLRILGATCQVLTEDGDGGASARRVSECAGVSVRTFYDHFPNLEAAVLAAYRMGVDCLEEAIRDAGSGRGAWAQGTLQLVLDEPALAELLTLPSPLGWPHVAAARRDAEPADGFLLAAVLGLVAAAASEDPRRAAAVAEEVGALLPLLPTRAPGTPA
jgi:AcrR family transcriptional regulator